ncbi:MAG TPA: YhdP family protein [Woeseiaceae bacterium]|nr:YhdP family protein [Woeseiaceae bacterium]
MPRKYSILYRLTKVAAYAMAGVVVLLAIAVGLFRLFLPRLPEYQEQIKTWASDAIGLQVEFTAMDARWALLGPELTFHNAELIRPQSGAVAIAADEVGVGVSLARLLLDRTLVVDTVAVRDTRIEIRELADGSWLFQGQAPGDWLARREEALGSIQVVGENIDVSLVRAGAETNTAFVVPRLDLRRDHTRTAVDFTVQLPAALGSVMTVYATQILAQNGQPEPWNLSVEVPDLRLAGVSDLYHDNTRQITSGSGQVDMSIAIAGSKVQSISAQVRLAGVALNNAAPFDVSGRLAFSNNVSGWLVAADEVQLTTANGTWPEASMRVEASEDSDHELDTLELRGSYLDLSLIPAIEPWLTAQQVTILKRWHPDGIVRNLVATLSNLHDETPRYAVTAELDRVGFAASNDLPGIRGFSGSLRADQDSGLLAVESRNTSLDLGRWVPENVEFDVLDGTLVWRRNGERLTILSDNIVMRNAVIDSQSSIEVVLVNGASPTVDLTSKWSITDIAVAKRFIPKRVMTPQLHDWFQNALVAGAIHSGTAHLSGPLNRFPFDEGGGRFLVKGQVTDATLQYLPTFPPALISTAEVVLDKTHLYTRRNRSTSQRNTTINARVDIRDLKNPVLEIKGKSSGTLVTLADFADNSPIDSIFGGQLDRLTLGGDATLDLDLTVPLKDWREFEFTATLTTGNGSIAVAGLHAPVTELTGTVRIQKDDIASDDLHGRFLGTPVAVRIFSTQDTEARYKVIADATGSATATALLDELGLPLEKQLRGATDYRARLRFPRAGMDPPAGLSVTIESDLVGMAVDLPAPVEKKADDAWPLNGEIVFEPGGTTISTHGRVQSRLGWTADFTRVNDRWDFDRGVVALGDSPFAMPDVRGLHISGHADEVRVEEWLALSRGGGAADGAGDRVRSVDIEVSNLYFLGQHLTDQGIRVDRSARDWLVQLDGADVSGAIFVPYEFTAANKLVLDMERFVLPGDDDPARGAAEPSRIDPRILPAISFRSKEFGIGERRFGAVEAEFVHSADGLVAEVLSAIDTTFTLRGSARWLADPIDPLDSRTYIDATVVSTDVVETMRRLGYQPGIVSDEMHIDLDLDWSGAPRADFLDTLDGEVEVRLGSGQLDEIEPGAGRVFGLVSVVALPRRLSLDFRDVFQKGFGFDEISGNFKLENGLAYTCNLSLEGPAADIAMIGQADLVAGEYEQTAVVNAKVGNTLPVVGALAAGPQVAAAMFLLSQIFKKPLQDLGQVYYSMRGSWDKPVVEATDAEAFATSARLAGCLSDSE